MKRIALLVYDVSLTGGAERVAINLANEFAGQDRVYILSVFSTGVSSKGIDERVSCIALSNHYEKIPVKFLKYKNKLRKILVDEKIDILMSITAGVVTLAIQAAKGLRTEVIYCEHSNLENRTYGRKHVFRQYFGAKKADAVVTLTERDRQNFIRMFKVAPERVFTIPNWYEKKNCSTEYNSDSKKIISVGRLEKVKGYEYTIDCADVILRRNPEWQWDIYGDGSQRTELQESISHKGIERLTLKGNVADIDKRYAEYAFLVMTSRYEGLPLSLLEAQTSLLPIVSFDCPTGPSEIIEDGVNGFVVPLFDVDALIQKIQRLIDSQEERISFSEHSQDKLCFYEKARVMRLWNELFQKLLVDGDDADD